MGHHEDGIYYPSNGYPKPSLWAGTPASARYPDGAKKKKKKEKEKLQKFLQIKRKLAFWEEKDTSTSKILFDVISFSPPPSYQFKKNPFQNRWEKFLNSFWTIL
jgi:hypothetical protein